MGPPGVAERGNGLPVQLAAGHLVCRCGQAVPMLVGLFTEPGGLQWATLWVTQGGSGDLEPNLKKSLPCETTSECRATALSHKRWPVFSSFTQ